MARPTFLVEFEEEGGGASSKLSLPSFLLIPSEQKCKNIKSDVSNTRGAASGSEEVQHDHNTGFDYYGGVAVNEILPQFCFHAVCVCVISD